MYKFVYDIIQILSGQKPTMLFIESVCLTLILQLDALDFTAKALCERS